MLKIIRIASGILIAGMYAHGAFAAGSEDLSRPIDPVNNEREVLAVATMRDNLREQGNMALGKALFTIGKTEFLGLNPSLNSFEVGTLETPLGGDFTVQEESDLNFMRPQRSSFETHRQKSKSSRVNRISARF